MENEIWKDIPGFEGLYQVSNLSRIKSVARIKGFGAKGNRMAEERILNPKLFMHGYAFVVLSKNYKKYQKQFIV